MPSEGKQEILNSNLIFKIPYSSSKESLSNERRARESAVHSIITSEEEFVSAIDRCRSDIAGPVAEQGIISDELHTVLFGTLARIGSLHSGEKCEKSEIFSA